MAAAVLTAVSFTAWIRGFEQGQAWFPDPRSYVVFLPHALVLLALLVRAPRLLALVVAGLHLTAAVVLVPLAGFGVAMLPGALLLVVAASGRSLAA